MPHSPGVDPIAEAGAAAQGVRTTELCRHCDDAGQVSPDGRYLSETDWAGSGDIAVRDLETGELHRLGSKMDWNDGPGETHISVFAPDGRRIAYNWLVFHDGEPGYEIRIIDRTAERPEPRVVYYNPEFLYIATAGWTHDERLLVWFQRSDWSAGFGFVSIETGELALLRSLPSSGGMPLISQDDRWLAFDIHASEDEASRDVYLLAADGSTERRVTKHPSDDFAMGFAADGKTLLFAGNRTGTYGLWGVELFEGGRTGEQKMLMRDIGTVKSIGVLPDGALIYGREIGSVDLYSAKLDLVSGRLHAKPRVIPTKLHGSNDGPWPSSDGKRIAYLSSGHVRAFLSNTLRRWLYIHELDSGQELEIRAEGLRFVPYYGMDWSPDDKWILAAAQENLGRWSLCAIGSDSGVVNVLIGGADGQIRPIGWTADGSEAIYAIGADGLKAIEAISLKGAERRRIYASEGVGGDPQLSPGRDRVAWRDSHTGKVQVMSIGGGDVQAVFEEPAGGGSRTLGLAWAPDGESLLLVRVRGQGRDRTEVWIAPMDGSAPIKTELTAASLRNFSVHPDGTTAFFQAGDSAAGVFRTENYLPASAAPSE